MSAARRIWLLPAALALVVIAACAVLLDRWAGRKLTYLPRQMLTQAAPGWMDAFRTVYRMPRLADLALPRTADGDGSSTFYSVATTWHPVAPPRGRPTAADSAQWRAIAADPRLDSTITAARQRGWDGVARSLPQGDSTDFFHFRPPPMSSTFITLEALRTRANERLRRHDLPGARTDVGALLSLGEQMLRHEPTITGMDAGDQAIRLALPVEAELARLTHDTLALARLDVLQKWASFQPSLGTNPVLFLAVPDSAYAMAHDTSMALGWRKFTLYAFVAAHLNRRNAVLFGVPRAARDSVAALQRDSNPDFARLAAVAVHAIDRFDAMSIRKRWDADQVSTEFVPL